jgi:peroxiredoxin Q/BCP
MATKLLKQLLVVICLSTLSVSASAMIGSKAPSFELPDQDGKIHNLSDYAGKWVVLYFYPKNHTSGCTVEAGEFRDNQATLDAMNTVVMGVSVDGVESHKSFHDDLKLNFDLLSDEQKAVSKAYNVLNDLVVLSYSKRQTFIIDPMGMIAHHFEKVDPETHATQVIEKLTEIQKLFSK